MEKPHPSCLPLSPATCAFAGRHGDAQDAFHSWLAHVEAGRIGERANQSSGQPQDQPQDQ